MKKVKDLSLKEVTSIIKTVITESKHSGEYVRANLSAYIPVVEDGEEYEAEVDLTVGGYYYKSPGSYDTPESVEFGNLKVEDCSEPNLYQEAQDWVNTQPEEVIQALQRELEWN